MTSRVSSKTKSSQKYITRNRVWLISLMTLINFLLYVVVFLVYLHNEKHGLWEPSHYNIQQMLTEQVAKWLSAQGLSTALAIGYAFLLGLTSFNYLYKSKTIDFYFSIPKKKMAFFRDVCINSILIYTIISAVSYFLSTVFAVVMGLSLTKEVAGVILFGYVSNFIVFLAYYGICALAQSVCGNTFISILMAAFFSFIELAIRFTVRLLESIYLKTYADVDGYLSGEVWSAPIYNTLRTMDASSCIKNAIIAVVAFVLAFFAYKFYKGEFAGKAVVYKGVRYLVKISVSLLAAVWAALILVDFVSYSDKERVLYLILGSVLGAVIVSSISEIVFALDIHAMFKRFWQGPILAIASVIVMCSFIYDWYSFDSYVPKKEEVVDCAIALTSGEANQQYLITDDLQLEYCSATQYASEYMHLPYTDEMQKFSEIGMQTSREWIEDESEKHGFYYNVNIIYRLKNKKTVYRKLCIPDTTDENLLNSIVGSDEYKQVSFTLDNIDNWRKITGGYNILNFGSREEKMSDEKIDDFLQAYREDMKHYNYTVASDDVLYDTVYYYKMKECSEEEKNMYERDEYELFEQGFPVYESFSNTIDFLKANEMFDEGHIVAPDIEDISYCEVEYDNSYRYTDNSSISSGDSYKIAAVYDRDVIEQILPYLVSEQGFYYSYHWSNPTKYSPYRVRVYLRGDELDSFNEYCIIKNNVPDAIKSLEFETIQ